MNASEEPEILEGQTSINELLVEMDEPDADDSDGLAQSCLPGMEDVA